MKHTEIWALIILMLFLTGIPGLGEKADGHPGGEHISSLRGEFIPEIRGLNITAPHTTLPGPRYCVNGNITVNNGAEFILEGQEIYINSSYSQKYSIIVMQGGTLIVRNSTIQNFSFAGYSFILKGRAEIFNSTISGIDFPGPLEKSGIQILSGSASITRSFIRGKGFGLYLEHSGLNLSDSTVECGTGAVAAYNSSSANITNTTIITSMASGVGLYSEKSHLEVTDSHIKGNNIGAGIVNTSISFTNTSFENNTMGLYLIRDGREVPRVKGCSFSGNRVAGARVYDSVEFMDTTFRDNGVNMPFESIGGLVVSGTPGRDIMVNISDSRFIHNRMGMTSQGASLRVIDTLFEDNTLFNGTSGAVIRAGKNQSAVFINCTFRDNPAGLDAHLQNSSVTVSDSLFTDNGAGVRVHGSRLTLSHDDFEGNDCGIEEHGAMNTLELWNSFNNNTANYRYLVRMRFKAKDGYNIPLSGVQITLRPLDNYRNFSQTLQTDSSGEAVGDVRVSERTSTEHSYFPYSVKVRFRGIENSTTITDEKNLNISLNVPFLRPLLEVGGLKVKNHGFSLFEDSPRVDEDSDILFYVKNTGKGTASNTTVMIMVDDRIASIKHITLGPGEKRGFSVPWTPEHEGKINISVKVYDPDEPDPTASGPEIGIEASENQRGYYYGIVLLSILAMAAMVWWIGRNIEGADEVMAEFTKKLRIKFADFLESIAVRLKTQTAEYVGAEPLSDVIPTGDITAWQGPSLSGTGRFEPWSIDDTIRAGRGRKKDVITVTIKVPPPEPEVVIEEPETETFEWVTTKGEKQKLKVDKKTLEKFTHPRLFICSRCDHSFVSTDRNAKCPWCGGNAILLKDL